MIKYLLVLISIAALTLVAACAAPATATPPAAAPTPTPCATHAPVSGATLSATAETQVGGRTTPTTPLPSMPTLSPDAMATQMARMQTSNPGAPTSASNAPQSALPPCATPTPTR